MTIRVFEWNYRWHFGEYVPDSMSTPSPWSAGYTSIAEATAAAIHEHAQHGQVVDALTGNAHRETCRRLGIKLVDARKGRSSPVADFNGQLNLLFKLVRGGKIDWPEFRDRMHQIVQGFSAGGD